MTAYLISFLLLSLSWHLDLMAFHLKDNAKLTFAKKRLELVKIPSEKNISGLNSSALRKRE